MPCVEKFGGSGAFDALTDTLVALHERKATWPIKRDRDCPNREEEVLGTSRGLSRVTVDFTQPAVAVCNSFEHVAISFVAKSDHMAHEAAGTVLVINHEGTDWYSASLDIVTAQPPK